MDRETRDSLNKETLIRLILSQAEAIERLTREIEALRADNAALRAKLDLPPKTPENSGTPPSQGYKAAGEECKTHKGRRRKPHAGAHRPLHPNPTAKRDVFASSCQHCGALFLDTPQFVCEAYDHIEIPSIIPHVTRVSLLGGACLCCARKFKAEPPQDMPKGSPFGPNLRALVIYLCLYEAHLVKRGVKPSHDLFLSIMKHVGAADHEQGARIEIIRIRIGPRGARWWRVITLACLYAADLQDPNHDAIMRIESEAPRWRLHSSPRRKVHVHKRRPPPRIDIGLGRSRLNPQ